MAVRFSHLIDRLNKKRLEKALIFFVIIIFCIQAMQASLFAYSDIGNIKGYTYFFASIISMGISGLGLILILAFKYRELHKVNLEKQKAVELLLPRVAAMEATNDGIFISEADGSISYANMGLARLHGYESTDEVLSLAWSSFFSENDVKYLQDDVFTALLMQWYWQGNAVGLRKDGRSFHQHVSITALEGGRKVWVIRDNTEVVNYIDLADQRLEAIEVAGDGIGIVDPKGNLAYLNKALMDLHGIAEDDLDEYIGQPWDKLYSEKGGQEVRDVILPFLKMNKHWKGDSVIQRTDGSTVHAEMTLTLLGNGGLIRTARDVTWRKESEKEKEDLQKQFFQAQKMEAIGRLAGGIAHDFNNILASLMGYAEFLMEDLPMNSREYGFAKKIMMGTSQAQGLVEQILTFSRRSETEKNVLDLVDAVNETIVMLQSTVPRGIALETDINLDEALILGNTSQIYQVLMNLSVNAIDAMEGEKGRLQFTLNSGQEFLGSDLAGLSMVGEAPDSAAMIVNSDDRGNASLVLGALDPEKDYICLGVTDTGSGMNKETLEHIFEPFYTTKSVDKGTGLGLSSVQGILIGHDGVLVISTELGKGTTFSLLFPIAASTRKDAALPLADAITGSDEVSVLLVEDEQHVREMMIQMIERMGYTVDCCCDGDEAVDHLRENPERYDIVVSDYTMPRMNGGVMAREIADDFPELPIIIVSGFSKRRLQSVASENPSIRSILRKPIRRDMLAAHMQAALSPIDDIERGQAG